MSGRAYSLECRLERLERANRRWKYLALAWPLLVLGLAASAAPVPDRPKVLQAQTVQVQDDKGKTMAELLSDKDGGRLVLHDANGKPRVKVTADFKATGPELVMTGDDGVTWVLISGHDASTGSEQPAVPGILVQDRKGVPVGEVGRRKPR